MDSSQSEQPDGQRKIFKTCQSCNKDFYAKSTFYLHKKSCNNNDTNCECGKSFMSSYTYRKHKKLCVSSIIAKQGQNDQGHFICIEESCSFRAVYKADFLAHLKDIHSIECNYEVKVFQNYAEFEDWKEDYETATKANFYLSRIRRKLTEKIKCYTCNRSGKYTSQSKGKRAPKAQGSSKIGFKCPASIKVQEKNDSPNITATIYPMHYGHDKKLAHLRISKSNRMAIANQLSLGIDQSRVLSDMFSIYPNSLGRQHLTTKKDLRNISKSYGLDTVQKHTEDHVSVEAYVDENLQNEKSIILYKRQGESFLYHPKEENCTLKEEDFALGLITNFQCKMLQKFGSNIICMDATHGTTSYNYKLITILVVDEFKEGVPVAWLISNRETYTVLVLFLTLLKRRVGNLSPEIIMTDKAPQYYDSWVHVFQGEPKKLLCHCHIYKDWRTNLNKIGNKEASSLLYKELCILIEESDEEKFNSLLENCLLEMRENEDTQEFASYFESEWYNIKEEWGKCYRVGSEINTNMYVEAFHKTLIYRKGYFKAKQGTRVDKCLSNLLKYSKDLPVKRLIKLEKGATTWKTTAINDRHRKSLDLPFTLIKETSPVSWEIHSELSLYSESTSADELLYKVKKEPVCKNNCLIKCQYCNICVHDYSCNCPDGVLKSNICKHVHLLVRFLNENVNENSLSEENNNYNEEIADEEVEELNGKYIFEQITSNEKTDLTDLTTNLVSKIIALT